MTKDHDRKAIIRARMAQTGESYTTARLHLFGQDDPPSDDAEPTEAPRTTFSMPNDDAATSVRRAAQVRIDAMYDRSGVDVEDDRLRVWMGEPSASARRSR